MHRLFFLFLILTQVGFAQETRYFADRFQTMVMEKTENERTYTFNSNVTYVEDQSKGILKRKITIYGLTKIEEVNEFVWYGVNELFEVNYKSYFKNVKGVFEMYGIDGSTDSEFIIRNDKRFFSQVWDDNGSPILVNGTGKRINIISSENEEMVTVYQDSIRILSYGVRLTQKDTIYYTHDKVALPKGGIQAFYTDLVKKLKYPIGAQLRGKEARIHVQFIVEENGKLTDFKALSNEGYKFEEKTLKKLESFPAWEPAIYHGRKVKCKYVLPVRFKLD